MQKQLNGPSEKFGSDITVGDVIDAGLMIFQTAKMIHTAFKEFNEELQELEKQDSCD